MTIDRDYQIEIVPLSGDTAHRLERVAEEVFDHPIREESLAAFLASDSHHMLLALDGDLVVGMASAVVFLHPDKPPQLWINEIGVGRDHRRRGIGTRLARQVVLLANELGCEEAWLATEETNRPARALYQSLDVDDRAEISAFDKPIVMYAWRPK